MNNETIDKMQDVLETLAAFAEVLSPTVGDKLSKDLVKASLVLREQLSNERRNDDV